MPILHRGRSGIRLLLLGSAAGESVCWFLAGCFLVLCRLEGVSSPALPVMRGEGGTVLWTCLDLSVKEGQGIASPLGRGIPNVKGARDKTYLARPGDFPELQVACSQGRWPWLPGPTGIEDDRFFFFQREGGW